MINHEPWLEFAENYALGTLQGDELKEFQAHLTSGCALCRAHVQNTQAGLSLMAGSLSPVNPPAYLKSRILEEIGEPPSPCGKMLWSFGAAIVALAALFVVSSNHLSDVKGQLLKSQAIESGLRNELAQKEETLKFLTDPNVHLVRLAGLAPSPDATGIVLWDAKKGKGLFLSNSLPNAPIDKVYELWAIAGDKPVAAGTFTVNSSGRAILELPALSEGQSFDKFAVTLEPAGGTSKPTGQMYLLGSL